MHPNPMLLHEFAQFLGCETPPYPTLLKPASLMNLPRYGIYDALPHPHPCLRTCIPFTHFSLEPSIKENGCAPPPHPHKHTLGPALPLIRSHLYCFSYGMKPDGRRANRIKVEKS